jgi:hypothetical protein
MRIDPIHQQIDRATDLDHLKAITHDLVKATMGPFIKRSPYVVVDAEFPSGLMFAGEREACEAFITGYCRAKFPKDDTLLAVCVNTPARMIVLPEDRFGEYLCPHPDRHYVQTEEHLMQPMEERRKVDAVTELRIPVVKGADEFGPDKENPIKKILSAEPLLFKPSPDHKLPYTVNGHKGDEDAIVRMENMQAQEDATGSAIIGQSEKGGAPLPATPALSPTVSPSPVPPGCVANVIQSAGEPKPLMMAVQHFGRTWIVRFPVLGADHLQSSLVTIPDGSCNAIGTMRVIDYGTDATDDTPFVWVVEVQRHTKAYRFLMGHVEVLAQGTDSVPFWCDLENVSLRVRLLQCEVVRSEDGEKTLTVALMFRAYKFIEEAPAPGAPENWLMSIPGDLCGIEDTVLESGQYLRPSAYKAREHVKVIPKSANVWRVLIKYRTLLSLFLQRASCPPMTPVFWCDMCSGVVNVRLLQCQVERVVKAEGPTVEDDRLAVDLHFNESRPLTSPPNESLMS